MLLWKDFTIIGFFFSNLTFLSEITCGLLTFITKIKMKNNKEQLQESTNLNTVNNAINVKNQKVKCKLHLLFLAIPAFFDFLQYNVLSYYCCTEGILLNALQEDVKNAKILSCLILCFLFLRTPIYKHQTIAIIITVIGVAINVIFICSNNSGEHYISNIGCSFLVFFVLNTLYVAKSVSEKYFMEKYKIYPFDVLLFQGLLGLIINVLFLIPASFIECKTSTGVCAPIGNEKIHYFEFDLLKIALKDCLFWRFMFLVYIGDIILYGFSVWTNYYFSPTHLNIAEGISTIFMWIVSLIWLNINDGYRNSIKPLVGNLLIVIGTLIYNEIIIFKFFNLHHFTKREITLRGENERLSLLSDTNCKVNKGEFNKNIPLNDVIEL